MVLFTFLFLAFPLNIQSIDGAVHNVYWRNYIHGDVPCDVFPGAPGKYIAQFNNKALDLIGSLYADTGIAIGIDGVKIITDKDIRVLCSPDHRRLYWENIDLEKAQDRQLQDAVKGGYFHASHKTSFIGRTFYEGEWRIGMVLGYEYPDLKGLWVWENNNKIKSFQKFFVLKYNVTDTCNTKCISYTSI